MPARLLDDTPVSVRKYDVLGQFSDRVAGFVCHAGLAACDHPGLTATTPISLTDMGPPLVRAGDPDSVQVAGQVPLTGDEVARINIFVARRLTEYEAARVSTLDQYVVCPHCVPILDPNGMEIRYRYNCGGFVIEAYRFADIDLLVTDEASLPRVSLDALRLTYPGRVQQRALASPERRESLGLPGEGPWGVVLPGYLLHALARDRETICNGPPYQPRPGDEYFRPPSPAGHGATPG